MNAVIKWMAEHPVAANLTMVLVVVVGVLSAMAIPQKTFPDFTLEVVDIRIQYEGASPGEIEQSIIRPIEDQISGIDGIDEVTATAREGSGQVAVSLKLGENVAEKLDEVKTEVDRITTFPEDAEEPTVTQRSNRSRALEIAIHGDASEAVLKELAEQLKTELTLLPSVSFVETANLRDYEISIEVDRDTLNAYGLTLAQVSQIVAANSLELPGGEIDTATLTIPLRTLGRNYTRADFENIVVLTNDAGAKVFLRDIATVVDGFEDSDISARFGGNPSATVNVFRVGDEQLLDIVDEVKAHLSDTFRPGLPEGVDVTLWQNDAEELQGRVDLLTKNAVLGLALVVLCLTLFLDFRLAFWSAAGIGVAFAASFAVLAAIGMSINMISLFGFILAIGIVVDNAIVVGENIYKNNERGLAPMEAAVKGTQRIAIPVVFSALTTVVAFTPLFQMPGTLGKFLGDIPAVVIIVLLLSLVQALVILPRNLSRLDVSESYRPNIVLRGLNLIRSGVDYVLQWFIAKPLNAALHFVTRRWLVPIGGVIGLMVLTVGLLAHGYVKFNFFPSIDGKFVTANIEMVDGTTFTRTETVAEQIRLAALRAGDRIAEDLPADEARVVENISVVIGQAAAGGGPEGGTATSGATLANVVVRVTDPELRDWPTRDYETAWRQEIGDIAGIKVLDVSSALVDAGDAIAVELSLPEGQDITPVVAELREGLRGIPGVFSIRDDLSAGRLEFKLALKEDARIYGVTLSDLASQMRNGFFGIEATRVQRGRDDVRVFVRLPKDQRDSVADLLDFKIRTQEGDLIALGDVAEINEGLAPTEILRRNGRTITTVTADVDATIVTSSEANAVITNELIPPLTEAYDGLIVEFGGEQRTQGDAGAALGQALGVALFVIFALLALVFRSYIQPLVVMIAIPLGLIGAVMGHLIMGLPLTILSIFGIIGLAGVVINNSLVMIDLYNEYLGKGYDTRTAVIEGTKDRFRPILLTSLTTFLGVYPLIMETSLQVMIAIPLGLIGAVMGHLIMGLPLTILSIFGIIGLAGVVINNSLVMIDLYNEYLGKGYDTRTAVIEGTKDRFRPILLTSLTTFLGVYPLIMETSLQAQFLIPLAVSIGYGVLFGTAIIILAVPAVFMAQARAADAVKFVIGRVSGASSANDLSSAGEGQVETEGQRDPANPAPMPLAPLRAAE